MLLTVRLTGFSLAADFSFSPCRDVSRMEAKIAPLVKHFSRRPTPPHLGKVVGLFPTLFPVCGYSGFGFSGLADQSFTIMVIFDPSFFCFF